MSFNVKKSTRRAAGFTLIEMLVVLVVLAALAALVVPRLGFVEAQAGNATAAATSAQLVSNLEAYKTTTGSYPLGMDSLIDETDAIYAGLWDHVGPSFGPETYLQVTDLTALPGNYVQSFGHGFAPNSSGERYVYTHVSTSTDPNNSATTKTVLDLATAGSNSVAEVIPYIPGPPPYPMLLAWYKAAGYPDGSLPAGTKLIALGIGPNSSTIGETMASTPSHSEQEADVYGRYIALFAIYESGKSAQLKAVVDSHGSSINSNIDSYREEGVEHE